MLTLFVLVLMGVLPPTGGAGASVRSSAVGRGSSDLLAQATATCANQRVADQTLCAGAVAGFVWGLPLVIMTALEQRTCRSGLNKLVNRTQLAGPGSTGVVMPNNDTLYSSAFLDLRSGPQVLTVPSVTGRYFDFQLIDMYTNTFANVGNLTDSGHGGHYAIVGPRWHGSIPHGLHRIEAPTPDVWLLGRTEVDGPADLQRVVALQHEYHLAPLARADGERSSDPTTPCGPTQSVRGAGLALFDEISTDMAQEPPPPRDGQLLRAMAGAGIGPGAHPSETTDPTLRATYAEALRLGASLVSTSAGHSGHVTTGGWRIPAVSGTFGTDYLERARVAEVGLGEQVPKQAIYMSATSTRTGAGLNGSTHSYEVRFDSAKALPPVGRDGFWSITVYNSSHFLVANPIHRYSIGNHMPGLVRGPHGSVTIVLSAKDPTSVASTGKPSRDDANWLPAPAAPFEAVLRIYQPAKAVMDGRWQPPPVTQLSGTAPAA